MQKQLFPLLLGLVLITAFAACKKDEGSTEPENITTIEVHLTATDGSLDQDYEWNDLDGPGGNAPTIDNILLAAGKTYDCHLHVYDRSKTPEDDLSVEIEAENTAHLFVYTPDGVNLTITAADTDDNGKPFRIETQWVAGTVSLGSLKIQLKHEPDKGAANPDLTGDTDFEVVFPVRVQ